MNNLIYRNLYNNYGIGEGYNTFDDIDENLINTDYFPCYNDSLFWDDITDDVPVNFDGYDVWTDGNNIYYSCEDMHYVYNKNKLQWSVTFFYGLNNFFGRNVWTDGTNIYYSEYTKHYKLNGKTWEPFVFYGVDWFDGRYVWTDGNNIYYSELSKQYKLNNDTWTPIEWEGFNNLFGDCVWFDGTNTYYSNNSDQYILNDGVWKPMIWQGDFSEIVANGGIWTNGFHIYYSYGSSQYRLNGNTWEPIVWDGLDNLFGLYVWTDGSDIYYAYNETYKKLVKSKKHKVSWKSIFNTVTDKIAEYIDPIIENINTALSQKQYGVNYGTNTSVNTGYYLITINSYTNWMLCFTLTLYQNYRATKVMISGYNYSTSYWYGSKAVILADSDNTTLPVYFGYTEQYHLWVAIPRNYYTGINISDVTNGYTQLESFENLFTIEPVDSLPGTLQTTVTATTSKIGFAKVATSGAYADLSGKPTIPTVNNGTLTIQRNGSNVATFTANQSGNTTANISVPAPAILVKSFTAVLDLPASTQTNVTVSSISQSGYTPIIAIYRTNSASTKYVYPTRPSSTVSSGSATFTVRNSYDEKYKDVTITVYVIFKKDIS